MDEPARAATLALAPEMCAEPLDLGGKSLLIFDPMLASKWGHWFEYDRAVAEFHAAVGCEVTIVCHADFAHSRELEALGATVLPRISFSPWQDFGPGGGLIGELARMAKVARHYREVLAPILGTQSFDCVFHPNTLASDLLAWSLMPRVILQRVNRVVLATWNTVGDYAHAGPPRFARKLGYWRLLARWLDRRMGPHWAFLTDSKRLGSEYERIAGLRPVHLPSPRAFEPGTARPPGEPLHFGSPGGARLEKGIDIFQAALERLNLQSALNELRVTIQWNRPVTRRDGSEVRSSAALEAAAGVRFVHDDLGSDEYDALMRSYDCIVLPYRRWAYQSRSSAVAIEAACAGIPMIYTAGTWLADFVAEQGAGIAVNDGDAEGLAGAILAMAADYPAHKARAIERSAIARARNSPEAFARVLWGAGDAA